MMVKPAIPGSVVPFPGRPHLPLRAEGEEVPEDVYWTRRWLAGEIMQRDGDGWIVRRGGQTVRVGGEPALSGPQAPIAPLTTR